MKIPFGIAQKGLNSIPGRRTSETLVTVADGSALTSNINMSNNANEGNSVDEKDVSSKGNDVTGSEIKTDSNLTTITATTDGEVEKESQVKGENIKVEEEQQLDEKVEEKEVEGTDSSRPVSMRVGAMGLPGLALPGLAQALPGLAQSTQPTQSKPSTGETANAELSIPSDFDLPPVPTCIVDDTEIVTVSDDPLATRIETTNEGEEGKEFENASFEATEDYPSDLPPPIPSMPPPDDMIEEMNATITDTASTTATTSTVTVSDSTVNGEMEHAAMSRPTLQKQKRSKGKKSIGSFKVEKESLWDD